MSPLAIAIFALLEKAIENEPAIAAELQKMFTAGNPTPADWQAFHDSVAGQKFEDVAPNAAANLPPESDAATVTQSGPVTPAESQPDAPQVAVAAAAVVCPKCQQPLVSNSPDNCNC